MTRRDIASHLGVAHETVSRALTALQQVGCIAVTYRDIELIDTRLLQDIQRITRGTWRVALRGNDGADSEVGRAMAPAALLPGIGSIAARAAGAAARAGA
jgi:CRP/FNR family transcriptional regulator